MKTLLKALGFLANAFIFILGVASLSREQQLAAGGVYLFLLVSWFFVLWDEKR